jgi:tetratricopeptide (TPR) repeat protein
LKPRVLLLACLLLSGSALANPSADSLYAKADQLWLDKQLEEAASTYQQALTLQPTAPGYAKLGGLRMAQNKTNEAVEAYQNAITLDTENPKLFMALAIAYLHRQEFTKASMMTQEAIRLDPKMETAKDMQKYLAEKEKRLAAHEQAMRQAHPGGVGPSPATVKDQAE